MKGTGLVDVAGPSQSRKSSPPARARLAGPGLVCLGVLATTLLAIVAAQAINPPGAPADHFLSYKTKTTKGTTKFAPLKGVALADDFENLNFDVKAVGDVLVPVGTNGDAVLDAATHLRAYKIKAVKGSPKHVKRLRTPVVNQLGTLLVDTVKPDLLLVPTAADPAISPPPPSPSAHNVDHYKCYLVRRSKGASKLPKGLQVTVADPFTRASKVLTVRALKHLCLPVDKKAEGIKNRLGELACYTVTPAKGQPKHAAQRALQVNNQFGPLALDTVKENELCVPSVAPIPTPTPAPSNGGLPTATITPSPVATSVQTATPTVVSTAGLPPDPAAVAPPPETGVATNVFDSTEFLYTGANPIQTGVAPGAIEPQRAAVVRGRVLDGNGAPLSRVAITILGHPEFGATLSRVDGAFDLAVNGGELLTLSYTNPSFLPVQRQVDVPWQDYAVAADVVMVQRDTQVTTVDLTASVPMQAARGNQVSDADGTRRATVLLSQGTQAEVVQPDGSTQPASALNIRLTEYTVGPRGPAAMPAALPATSGYTYAVEISADEAATKIDGKDVLFSQPVFFYVENFLDFPAGTIVPVGFYDGDKAAWIPSSNGRVIAIVGVTSGLADLDTDGDGIADDGAGLGITPVERQQLANLYQTGQSVWRVPLSHFSTWDLNLPFGLPADATAPNVAEPETDESVDQCLEEAPANSVIECQNQILGETIGVVGTPFALDYRSDRVPGRTAAKTLSIQLSGPSVPASLKRIELDIQVAGRVFRETFPATTNQNTAFTWDGKDAYGRTLHGSQRVTGNIGYVYDGVYTEPGTSGPAFGLSGGTPVTGSVSRQEVTISQPFARVIGPLDARGQSLGAWALSVHHAYDPAGRVVYLGNGKRQSARDFTGIATVAGTGSAGFSGDDGAATEAQLSRPFGLAVRPDGSFYIADSGNRRVRLVALDGTITTVAGTGAFGFSGDGGLATEATLTDVRAVALGPDGSLYIADNRSHNIRRVAPDGIITTVAGVGGTFGYSGDGGPATEAELAFPVGLALGPDGTLYIGESGNHIIRRVAPDGIITTLAGDGTDGFSGDGGPATQAQMEFPTGVALGPDGSLYLVDVSNDRIRRVTPDGIITTVAGTDTPISGDGGPATQAQLSGLFGIAVGPDGSLYLTDGNRIRRVAPDGIITTIAGTGTCCFSGDGGPATQAQLSNPLEVALGPDGSLYIAEFGGHRIRQVAPPLPGFSGSDIAVASEDGGSIYQFDAAGRHLRTLDSLTGAAIYTFTYDAAGRLDKILDGDGNETTIQHDAGGNPTVILGPFGQQTTLTVDANGFLASVTNPADETVAMTYTADGLLTAFTDARDEISSYEYDELGRLTRTQDPAGGSNTLTRTELPNGHELSKTTALGRTSTYRVERLATGDQRLTTTASDGTVAQIDLKQDGTQIALLPDGTTATTVLGPDPRFGMQAPVVTSATVEMPSGLTSASSQARTVVLSDPDDLLSVSSLTETSTVNGRTITRQYDRSANTLTETTPAGRQRIETLDVLRRVVRRDVPGLAPITYAYDARGLTSVVEGTDPTTRTMLVAYDARGYVERIDQPEGLRTDVATDDAGRLSAIVLPGNRTITYGYDAAGNVTSITPPGRPSQLFAHDPRGRLSGYTAPDGGDGPETTAASRNTDRQLTQRALPGGATIDLAYDAATGRLVSQTLARGTITYAFDPATGHLASISAPDGVVLAYETDGPLPSQTEWSGPVPGTVERVYDSDFRTVSLAVNGADAIGVSYDGDGLVVGAGGLAIVRDGETGRVLTTALGDVTDARAYGDFEELTGYGAAFDGTSLFDVQLAQDDLGRVAERTETIGGVTSTLTYVYDPASRLAEVREGATTIASYAYDANGNRLSHTTSGGTLNGTYDAQDRLLQYGSTSFEYDAAGQLSSKTLNGQTTTYAYDEAGNLLEVTLPNGTVIEYVIDGANRRIGRKVNGTLTEGFLYQDRVRPIAALDGSGNVVSRFVHALPGTAPDFMIKGGATFRIITDPIGSPRLVVDVTTGSIAQRMDYDEFGNVTLDTNPGFQPFGFAGGLYDPATKLVRFGLRDYDAATGRWTAKDPALVTEESLYAYAANDPVNLVDRLGRDPNEWDEWLNDGVDDVVRSGKLDNGLEPKETQVFESPKIQKVIDELAADRRAIGLLRKLDDLAEFAAKKVAPPVKICVFIATVAGLADRAEAADRNVIDQALAEQSPIEPEVGAEAIRSGGESILGPIKDAIRGAFEEFAQRPL